MWRRDGVLFAGKTNGGGDDAVPGTFSQWDPFVVAAGSNAPGASRHSPAGVRAAVGTGVGPAASRGAGDAARACTGTASPPALSPGALPRTRAACLGCHLVRRGSRKGGLPTRGGEMPAGSAASPPHLPPSGLRFLPPHSGCVRLRV